MKNDVTAEKNDLGFGVSPEMVKAGLDEFSKRISIGWDDGWCEDDDLESAIISIFLAMDKVRNESIAEIKGKPIEVNPEMIKSASDWFETNIAWGLPVIYGRNEIEEKMKELLNESLNSSSPTKE